MNLRQTRLYINSQHKHHQSAIYSYNLGFINPLQVNSSHLLNMLFTPLFALTFAAIAPIVTAYPITGDGVNCRSGPGTSYSVVKSYKKGADVSITCQAPGTDVKGDSIWDKTADGCYVADYYVKTGSSSYVTKNCDDNGSGSGGGSSGNLPGLTSTQSKHAKAIIGEAKKEGLGRQGCLAGIATALVEVSFDQDASSIPKYI
jgi:hypothetical protein